MKLDSDGRPTEWKQAADLLDYRFANSVVAAYTPDGKTGFVYLTGGVGDFNQTLGSVWVAPIDAAGVVGPFTQTTSVEPGLSNHSAVVAGRHLYLAGGRWWSGGSYTGVGTVLPLVRVADIGEDGTLGPWREVSRLPSLASWNVFAYGERLYALSATPLGIEVLFAGVYEDGSIGEWERASAQPPGSVTPAGLVAAAGHLYAAGSSDPSAGVLVGTIGSRGDVAAWESNPADNFDAPRRFPVLASDGAHLYAMDAFSEMQWATIDPATGHLATFVPPARPQVPGPPRSIRVSMQGTTASVSWDAPSDDGGAPIRGYAISGVETSARLRMPAKVYAESAAAVRTATFTGLVSGSAYRFEVKARNAVDLGPTSGPSDEVVATASPRWRPIPWAFGGRSPVVVADDLFVFGQQQGFGALPLASDGFPWTQIGPGFQGNARTHGYFAQAVRRVDERTVCAYQVGGDFWTTGATYVLCLKSDGFFGDWFSPSLEQPVLEPTRRDGAAVVAGSFLYALGGLHGDPSSYVALNDVSAAPVHADAGIGNWVHTTPLPAASASPLVVARGNDLYLLTSSGLLRSTAGGDGALSPWRATGPTLPVDPTDGRVAISQDFIYLITKTASVVIGRLDSRTGDLLSWDSDPADALAGQQISEVATGADRLYVFADSALLVARIDPATGHPLP